MRRDIIQAPGARRVRLHPDFGLREGPGAHDRRGGAPVTGLGRLPAGSITGFGRRRVGGRPGVEREPPGGRPGASTPRVPTSVSTPGGTAGPTDAQTGIAGPRPLPIGRVPLYGSLEIPAEADEGPPGGLTLDQAIDRLLRENLELRAQFIEIPMAEADILTASLRANPIFYADSQLIPYGKYTRDRPGGQTQYDVNISYPLDVSHKRRARTQVAVRAKRVLEAQYQDAARRTIDNLYTAYVDVLAARQNVRYARASVEGLQKVLLVTQRLYEKDQTNRADVNRVKVQVDSARIGLADAEESLRRSSRVLGGLLNLPPSNPSRSRSGGRSATWGRSPRPPTRCSASRWPRGPTSSSFRLGVGRAEADVRLALANRFSDVYVLYQPYTFQDNAPLGLKSAHSWALGVTVPLPIYNRNQGGIQRAKLNVGADPGRARGARTSGDHRGPPGRDAIRGHPRCGQAHPGRPAPLGQASARRHLPPLYRRRGQRRRLPRRPARLQRRREAIPRRGGPPPSQHAGAEYGGRAAHPALNRRRAAIEGEVQCGRATRFPGGIAAWPGRSHGNLGVSASGHAIRFLTTSARSVPVSVKL